MNREYTDFERDPANMPRDDPYEPLGKSSTGVESNALGLPSPEPPMHQSFSASPAARPPMLQELDTVYGLPTGWLFSHYAAINEDPGILSPGDAKLSPVPTNVDRFDGGISLMNLHHAGPSPDVQERAIGESRQRTLQELADTPAYSGQIQCFSSVTGHGNTGIQNWVPGHSLSIQEGTGTDYEMSDVPLRPPLVIQSNSTTHADSIRRSRWNIENSATAADQIGQEEPGFYPYQNNGRNDDQPIYPWRADLPTHPLVFLAKAESASSNIAFPCHGFDPGQSHQEAPSPAPWVLVPLAGKSAALCSSSDGPTCETRTEGSNSNDRYREIIFDQRTGQAHIPTKKTKGKQSPEQRADAQKIRKMRACEKCRTTKHKCSVDHARPRKFSFRQSPRKRAPRKPGLPKSRARCKENASVIEELFTDAPGPSTLSEQQKVSARPSISYGASLRPSLAQISCTGIDFALAAGSDTAQDQTNPSDQRTFDPSDLCDTKFSQVNLGSGEQFSQDQIQLETEQNDIDHIRDSRDFFLHQPPDFSPVLDTFLVLTADPNQVNRPTGTPAISAIRSAFESLTLRQISW